MDAIGKYRIEAKLGQGGMGIVYRCRDTESNRLAAIKVLPQQLAADATFLQRFKREVVTLQRLDHPNIVKIYDRGVYDGAPYYAMEYVEGISFDDVLATGDKMPPLRAIQIIRACAEALKHSHAVGIVHRDIKPANIMIDNDNNIKLMDFGIAKVLDATRMTATQGVLGTVEYMSPEQSRGRQVDARSDLYSLGVVLYKCLTARLPVTGSNPSEIFIKLRTHQIEAPIAWVPELPKNLSDLVMKLLEKEPENRLESAHALIRELDRVTCQIEAGITGHGPVGASDRLISTPPTTTPLLRNPWLYGFILVAALLGIFILRRPATRQLPPIAPDTQPAGMRAKLMLVWARKAANRKDFEYATDLCNLILKHYPDSEQAKHAAEIIKDIKTTREDAAALRPGPFPG